MHKQNNNSTGFTIVELLIVIVVIAILAAISVIAYRGIQDRAINTMVEADMAAIIKKLELAKVDLGHYPQSLSEFPDGFKFSKSAYTTEGQNIHFCLDIPNDVYALGLRSKSNKHYMIVDGAVVPVESNSLGTATCNAIGKTFVNDATTYAFRGISTSSTTQNPDWNSGWNWTN